jgi:hypothetical protein
MLTIHDAAGTVGAGFHDESDVSTSSGTMTVCDWASFGVENGRLRIHLAHVCVVLSVARQDTGQIAPAFAIDHECQTFF